MNWELHNRILQPAGWRIQKVGGIWFVRDLERPDEFIRQVSFKTRKAALDFAQRNADAVYERVFGNQ